MACLHQTIKVVAHPDEIRWGGSEVMEAEQIYFERYKVHKKLGEGAYGIVWLAEDQLLHRQVAIKELANQGHEVAQRLVEEASAAAQTGHPNIVQVYDVIADQSPDGLHRYVVVMEFLAGGTLRQHLHQHGRLPPAEALKITLDVCYGLQIAHNKTPSIIHGDIKPDNILFDDRGVVKVTDFGAYVPQKLGGQSYRPAGTPLYQTPQLLLNIAEVTAQDDLYAVVVMLYEMLCDSFIGEDEQFLSSNFYLHSKTPIKGLGMLLHLFVTRARLVLPRDRNPTLPPELDPIFEKGLAYEPSERYLTVEALLEAIEVALKYYSEVDQVVPTGAVPESSNQLIQTITSGLRHGWVIDPWQEDNPYSVLETLFIGPRSSMREIRDCVLTQMSEPQRAAWNQLQVLPSRLLVDGFLHCLEYSHELVAEVKKHLTRHHHLPPSEQIPPALQNEWPLILLLLNRREDCLLAWTDIQRTEVKRIEPTVTHNLAVTYTFLAQQQEQEGQIGAAITSWRKAIANWVWILAADDFWMSWTSKRAQSYQVRVAPRHITNLQQQLQDHIISQFTKKSAVFPPDCPEETRQVYEELNLDWELEWAGTQALKRIQVSEFDSPMFIPTLGPALLSELGLEETLARLVLERTRAAEDVVFLLTSPQDAKQAHQDVQEVRLYYSQLSRSVAYLNRSQPERALTVLPVEERDSDFDRFNPAYQLLPDKQMVWEKDRTELTMRIQIQLANTYLQREHWDVEAIATQWTQIISLGDSIDNTDLSIEMIQDQALAYLQFPTEDASKQRLQLALAETAKQIIGFTSRLEPVLTRLQIMHHQDKVSNKEPTPSSGSFDLEDLLKNIDSQPPEQAAVPWQEQVKKLYTMLQATPGDEDTREQLAQLLLKWLEQLIDEGQVEFARQTAAEWYVKLDKHRLLKTPYRYLKQGYKVALYLPQTELVYNVSLVEAHTYSFGLNQKYVSVIAKLKVEGDLVRIFAPLPRFTEPFKADIQHNLLQITWNMPLCKAYRTPGGEYGLMIEISVASLNPVFLEQLVRSLACRVDLTLSHLQSLNTLQQVMDKYASNFSLQAEKASTEQDFERWQSWLLAQCRQLGLECTLTGDYVYRLNRQIGPGEPIHLNFQTPVVTFEAYLGNQYQLDHNLYERMMGWNSSTRLCKLTLASDDAMILRCELLNMNDKETLTRMLNTVFEALTQAKSLLAWHIL